MDTKLQVFGGLGFVGSNFVKQYPNVIVNDRNDYTVKSKNILYLISTISNYNMLTDPYVDINTNLTTLMRVLEQCKDKDVTFNFVSSWFVYGDTEMPAQENSPCRPTGFYSITKKAAEDLLVCYAKVFNIKYRILRLANVVGPGDPKASLQKNALQFLINEIKANKDIKIYDGGNMYRDYMHVTDVARAVKLVIDQGDINTVYNIGNGKPIKFKTIIEYAHTVTNSSSRLVNIEPPEFHKIVQVHSMFMNTEKLKKLGYKPLYSMEQIVEDMIFR
jgi:nucleoside-diphosphate-sugar epimerase